MTDILGFTLYPILSNSQNAPSTLYYFDLQYERGLSNDRSLLISLEKGRLASSETFSNNIPLHKIETNSFALTFEFREYYSNRKSSPLGFYSGLFYKHYFVKEKYYDYEEGTYNFYDSDKGNIFSLGGRIGYKFGDRIIFDPSVLLSIAYTSGLEIHDNPYDEMKWLRRFSFPVYLKLSIGYRF
ncbi:MAG: hypothetical protein IPM71_16035 [Bacteroidota bacterium]|nr:MAG: hypothetical protein IPM71_16035 [Bacteroidota bacterium]